MAGHHNTSQSAFTYHPADYCISSYTNPRHIKYEDSRKYLEGSPYNFFQPVLHRYFPRPTKSIIYKTQLGIILIFFR